MQLDRPRSLSYWKKGKGVAVSVDGLPVVTLREKRMWDCAMKKKAPMPYSQELHHSMMTIRKDPNSSLG